MIDRLVPLYPPLAIALPLFKVDYFFFWSFAVALFVLACFCISAFRNRSRVALTLAHILYHHFISAPSCIQCFHLPFGTMTPPTYLYITIVSGQTVTPRYHTFPFIIQLRSL
jgi:hypothetical protein